MAIPVSEQIAVIIRNRLALISTANSYETTTTGVVRGTQRGDFQPKDYQIVLTQGNKTENKELSCPGSPPLVAWDQPFLIAGILRQSETDQTAIDTLKNVFEADVIKALNTGVAWWNMEAKAINSTVSGATWNQSDSGSDSSFELTLLVTYRTAENDPYTEHP